MRRWFVIFLATLVPSTVSGANPLDDCTLQNMAGVTSDAAARFVREACLGKISSAIPLKSIEATGSIASGAFYMHLENKSPYAITELMVRIVTENGTKLNDYRVTNFAEIYTGPLAGFPGVPPGAFPMQPAPPADPARYLQIKPFSTAYFVFVVREQIPEKNAKWGWDLISAKGYLAASD